MSRHALAALMTVSILAITACAPTPAREEAVTDYVKIDEYLDLKLPPYADSAPVLKGPHAEFDLTGRKIGPRIEGFDLAMGKASRVRAGDGYELVAVTVEYRQPENLAKDQTNLVRASVRLGERVADLRWPGRFWTIAASVPTGTPITLAVTDDGRTQSIDLRTGTPAADVVPELQNPPIQQLAGQYKATGLISAGGRQRTVTMTMKFTTAERRMYRPDLHWAAPGRCWLAVSAEFTTDAWDQPELYGLVARYLIDMAASFALTLPDGTRVSAMPGTFDSSSVRMMGSAFINAHFDVPASTRGGTVTLTPTGVMTVPFTDGDQRVNYAPRPASTTVIVALPS